MENGLAELAKKRVQARTGLIVHVAMYAQDLAASPAGPGDVRGAIGNPVDFRETRSRSQAQYHVCDVMTKPAIVVPCDRPLVEVARRFADDKLGALPVVDRFGALIGILSYVDVLRVLTR